MSTKRSVLLVERAREATDELARALVDTFDGLQVERADTFVGAIAAIDRATPNLIVSALELPDGSGLGLLSEVGNRGLPIPFVIVCDDADAYRDQLRSTGNVRLLERPVGLDEFSEVVGEQLTRASVIPPSRSPFAVSDYLQLAAMAQRSLALEVSVAGAAVGEIFVVEGQAYHAADRQGEGGEAFSRLALATEVDIEVKPLPAVLGEPSLEGGLQHLLFEAARVADEQRRASSPRPVGVDESTLRARQGVQDVPRAVANPARAAIPPPPRSARPSQAQVWRTPIPRRGDSEAPLEILVSPPVSPLDLVASVDGLRGAAAADADGVITATRGQVNLEFGAKIGALTRGAISEAVAAVGIPELLRWRVSAHDDVTWYVLGCGGGLLVAEGDTSSNPRRVMGQLALAIEGLV